MSLLLNMLSRLVITFFPRSKCLLISWLQSLSAVTICRAPKNKVWHCFHCFPIYFPWNDGTSHFSPVQIFVTLWTIADQAPLSLGFSRQEYRSGLSCPPPEGLSDPEIEPAFLISPTLSGRFFTTRATWEAPRIPVFIPISFTTTFWIWEWHIKPMS